MSIGGIAGRKWLDRAAAVALLAAVFVAPAAAVETADAFAADLSGVVAELRKGGYVIFFRHALTEQTGVTDETADLNRCERQRNLSAAGRAQATNIGKSMKALGIPVGQVLAGPYCRTKDTARLASTCFGITAADEIGYAIAQALVLEIGGEPVRVSEQMRPLYHAALAHGSNHLVTLVADAVEALRVALAGDELLGQQIVDGAPGGVAERVLQPLLTAALDNVLRRGPSALTGPVARGDADTVATHLQVLDDADPQIAAGYRAMSLRSAQRTGSKPELMEILERADHGE